MNTWGQAAIEAAQLLNDLEAEYEDMEVETGRVMIVVELNGDLGTEDEWTGIFYRCSDPKRWIQYGMLDSAKRAVIAASEEP